MTILRRRVARFLLAFAVVAGLGAYAFLHAGTFLAAPGREAVPADAVFVLGGSSGDRELQAAELYRRGRITPGGGADAIGRRRVSEHKPKAP